VDKTFSCFSRKHGEEMKKNILLIPTTDHTVKSFYYSYKDLTNKYNFYFVLDNKNIKNRYNYQEIKQIAFSGLSRYKHLNIFEKIFAFYINSRYIKYKVGEILGKYSIDCVIVSNDCPMPQSIFVKTAKQSGIKVIAHQLASGIINPNLKPVLKNKILNFIAGNLTCKKFGSNSDSVWLMGNGWKHITDNDKVSIATNGYYYYFDQIYKDCINLEKVKLMQNRHKEIKIVFYSSPFYEINLLSRDETIKVYEELNIIASILKSNYRLFFKAHPQEKLYQEFGMAKNIILLNELTSEECIEFADIGISVGSSMSLQTKLLKKSSFGYWPSSLPEHYKENSKVFFDSVFTDANDFLNILNSNQYNNKLDINEYFYIKEAPLSNIENLLKVELNEN
jgi:hypothetical protein